MPHSRSRSLLPVLLKRRKLWPVLGIIGPRQVGKSTLLRDFYAPATGAAYVTLDSKSLRDRAERAPEHFLAVQLEDPTIPLIIDEVQKAPSLFDAIKASVDLDHRPGRYVISGSTQFSQKTGVRESLTGRIGVSRLYPMTLAELAGEPPRFPWPSGKPGSIATLAQVELWMTRGGMPGSCFLRSGEERHAYFESWLETTCYKDIEQIRTRRLSGALTRDVLESLAQIEIPTVSEIAHRLRVDARRVAVHLELLELLCLVYRLDPHPLGVGKPEYVLFDAGIATHLGASWRTQLRIFAVNECLAQFEYSSEVHPRLYYYRSAKRSYLDLVVHNDRKTHAILLSDEEAPSPYALRAMHRFQEKDRHILGWVLAPTTATLIDSPRVRIIPWSGIA